VSHSHGSKEGVIENGVQLRYYLEIDPTMQANLKGISIHITKTSYGPGIRQQYNRTRRSSSKSTNMTIRPSSSKTPIIPELKCTSVGGDFESKEYLSRTDLIIFHRSDDLTSGSWAPRQSSIMNRLLPGSFLVFGMLLSWPSLFHLSRP